MGSAATQEWKISVLAVAVLLAIVFTFDPIQKRSSSQAAQPPSKAPAVAVVPTGNTSLSLIPAEIAIKTKKEATINVVVDSQSDKISAAELRLKFDSKFVNSVSVLPDDFFANPSILLNQIDNKKGEAVFAVGTLSPKSGRGNLAMIKITGVRPGTTSITLTQDSKIAALGKTENVLGKIKNATVRIQ